ncbi:hypothetical protein [Acinetobacter sp.]|uniref:hypothetical protein n=1 Tax=Acinetobacter sp. TaxID=472 RepID=UPI00388FCB6E
MKLDELLDKPTEFKILQNEPHAYYASFNVAGREIQFFASNEGAEDDVDEGEWDISFGELQMKKRQMRMPGQSAEYQDLNYGKTGSGGELEVFSTLKAILVKFIKERDPEVITFSADKNDGNRAKLYARMFKKNLPPGWELQSEPGADHEPVYFMMVKESLSEALDKPLPYKVTNKSKTTFQATFIVGKRKILFEADQISVALDAWVVSFYELGNASTSISKKTGSGNEFEVFATIKKIIEDFIEEFNPRELRIDSFKGEANRGKLYSRMLKKNLPIGWNIEKDDSHPSYELFILKKD